MNLYYRLDGKTPVPCSSEDYTRTPLSKGRVAKTEIGGALVSTVFLGIDHQCDEGPPLLFETMVFGGPLDEEQERCSTWAEAEEQHRRMVDRVRRASTFTARLGRIVRRLCRR